MNGIQYVVDETGKKKAVIIDLKMHSALWEDFCDQSVVQSRKKEPRVDLEASRRRLIALGKLPQDA